MSWNKRDVKRRKTVKLKILLVCKVCKETQISLHEHAVGVSCPSIHLYGLSPQLLTGFHWNRGSALKIVMWISFLSVVVQYDSHSGFVMFSKNSPL